MPQAADAQGLHDGEEARVVVGEVAHRPEDCVERKQERLDGIGCGGRRQGARVVVRRTAVGGTTNNAQGP